MTLDFPLLVYVNDQYRWTFFSDPNSMLNYKACLKRKNPEVIILDDNPLSIAMYMEEHPQYSFDDCDRLVQMNPDKLGPEDMLKLDEMLKKVETKHMSAQELIDSVGGKR